MLSCEFQKKLKRLNPRLRMVVGNNPLTPAGVELVIDDGVVEPESICAIDKNFIPEKTITDKYGHFLKGGWRRVVNLLILKKLVSKTKAERVFGTEFTPHTKVPILVEPDPIHKEIASAMARAEEKFGKVANRNGQLVSQMARDSIMDIASEIRKKKAPR